MNRAAKITSAVVVIISLVIFLFCLSWQRYVSAQVAARAEQKQAAYIARWLPVAVQAQHENRTGQQVIDNCLQYGGLSAANKTVIEQQYQAAIAQPQPAR